VTVCSSCGHENASGKDFCSECGDFLGFSDEPAAPITQPARVAPIGPSRAPSTADDPAIRQAEEEARAAEEEARLVRARAEIRAREATQTAKRMATEEARGARAEAYGRAEQAVEHATLTAKGSQAEVAALVAQVRQEAESKARAEVDDAELRAARRARREREQAHARAQAEAAEAEHKATEAAKRASALIAQAPAKVTQEIQATQPTPVTPTPKPPVAGGGHGVAPVKPIQPGPPVWQPPPADTAEVAPITNPGDISCRICGTGNDPSRRFCRKCGESLVFVPAPPVLTWSQRMRTWLQLKLGRLRRRPGEPQQEPPAPGSSGPGLSLVGVTRGALAVVAVVGIFAAVGPYRHEASADVTSLRKRVVPKPSYVDDEVATAGKNQQVITTLTDKTLDPVPFTSTTINTSNIADPNNLPVFSVAFGKDGGQNKAVNLFKVGVVGDKLGPQPPTHPYVEQLLLVAYGIDNRQRKAKTFTLRDNNSFQSFLFNVNHVVRVDFYVLNTYNSATRTGAYTIDQAEFFALT
jgi:hypothetical protein